MEHIITIPFVFTGIIGIKKQLPLHTMKGERSVAKK